MKNKSKLVRVLLYVVPITGILLLYANKKNPSAIYNVLVASDSTSVLLIGIFAVITLLSVIFLIIYQLATRNEKNYLKAITKADKKRYVGEGGLSKARPLGNQKEVKMGKNRFYMLSQIDKDSAKFYKEGYNEEINLKDFCEQFRNFSANRLKLYYHITDIRRFIASLSVSHILILQGMSGTGKTSLAYAFGEFINNKSTVVPIQPMWKERTDLIGYYNEFTKKFNETTLLQKMYEANYSKDIYITVLDEMNIARVEYYFAEFLSLLELPNPDRRYLDVISDKWNDDPKLFVKGQIKLPNNMWFIGTANNDDSTFAISDKVYDRAMILNLDYKSKPFAAPNTQSLNFSADYFFKLVEDGKKEFQISNRNLERIRQLDEFLIKNFHITFGNRIMKQIGIYVPIFIACGGDELEAIDDILVKKVLRKLESQNPIYIKESAGAFITYLNELFGDNKMKYCIEFMQKLQKSF